MNAPGAQEIQTPISYFDTINIVGEQKKPDGNVHINFDGPGVGVGQCGLNNSVIRVN